MTGTPRSSAGRVPTRRLRRHRGFEELVEVLADPTDEEHEEMLEWVGGSYDPGAFDIEELNAALDLYDRHTRQRPG